jgi:hypothetical protein
MNAQAHADEQNIELAVDTPKLKELLHTLDEMVTHASYYYSRTGLWFDTRYALWAGQSDDGRKNADAIGEAPFPWDGASDTRVRLADRIIKERKRLRKMAFWGKRIQARPLSSVHAGWAAAVNPLLKWLVYAADPKAIKRELSLKWSFEDTYGACITGVFWHRDTRLAEQTIILSQLQEQAQASGDPQMIAGVQVLSDPLRVEENTAILMKQHPQITRAEAKAFLNELHTTGTATLKVPQIASQKPRWVALRPFVDVFFDPACDDIQKSRMVAYREFLTESELKERVLTEGWKQSFVDAALKHKGSSILSSSNPLVMQAVTRKNFQKATLLEDTQHLIEVLHCYYHVNVKGAEAIYCTVLHPEVKEDWGMHDTVEYGDGEYPFEDSRAEVEERSIMESRGVPEIVMTWQNEQKLTRDFHADRMSMDVIPPLLTPKNMAGQAAMGPAQQLERSRRGDDYEFLSIPPMSQTSLLFNKEIEREICAYFGMFHPETDPIMVQAARQELVTDALMDVSFLIAKSFSHAQDNLSDEELSLICGWAGAQQVRVSREMIQGKFLVEFLFDVRTLDTEFLETYGKIFKDIIQPLDRAGQLDMSQIVSLLLGSVDPNLQSAMQSHDQVRMGDIEDEQNQLAKILTGIEPPTKEVTNPQLRLQQMMQTAQSSPRVQQLIAGDPVVAALWENRAKMLKQQLVQQSVNPDIGRFGVQPVLGGDGSGMPPQGISRLDYAAGKGMDMGGMGQ